MTNGIRLGRVAGIEVFLDWSLLLIFALVTMSLGAGRFPVWHPDWHPVSIWLTALLAAALFFASIFLHELSHALVGRAQGMDVKRITLFLFGGVAHLEDEPKTWKSEFWMASAGPAASLVLGAAFLGLAHVASGRLDLLTGRPDEILSTLGPVATLLLWLGPVNVVLGVFNLVPGFPLDGGRILRALLWGMTGDVRRATRWASGAGRAFAMLLVVSGIAMMFGVVVPFFGTGVGGGIWLVLIGWFLHSAAKAGYRQVVAHEAMAEVPVAQLMNADVAAVDPETPILELVDERLLQGAQRAFPVVVDGGRLVGLVCLHDIRTIHRGRWGATPVAAVMTPVDRLVLVGPDADIADALSALARRGVDQLPVVEGGRLRGLIRREDILAWLMRNEGTARLLRR